MSFIETRECLKRRSCVPPSLNLALMFVNCNCMVEAALIESGEDSGQWGVEGRGFLGFSDNQATIEYLIWCKQINCDVTMS